MGAGSSLDDSQIQVSLAAVDMLTALQNLFTDCRLTVYGPYVDCTLTALTVD